MNHTFDPQRIIQVEHGEVGFCLHCNFWHVTHYATQQDASNYYAEHYQDPLKKRSISDKIHWLQNYYEDQPISILDIGCGYGDFLQAVAEKGWMVQGIEPSKKIAAIAQQQGIPVINHMYQDIDPTALAAFDVVHLSFVLEHIPHPIPFLKTILERNLKDHGILLVEVPNDFNAFQTTAEKQLAVRPWWIQLPDHQNYFSHRSLPALLESLNLQVLYQTTGFPIDIFLVMGENYVDHPELGPQCHQKRVTFEDNLDAAGNINLRHQLYFQLAQLGLGREVICYAHKNSPTFPILKENKDKS